MKGFIISFCLMIGVCLIPTSSWALADSLKWENRELCKVGQSQVNFLSFIKIFDAALYLENSYETKDYPGDFLYALRFKYQRAIKREALIKSAEVILNDLYTEETLRNIGEKLESINQVYENVNKGDEYTLVYSPMNGTTLLYNGQPKITLSGRKFADIYFSIWLGGHPKSKQLKRDLLDN